ncbi:MAG: hypothetical protein L3K03_03610 [Thermoplasmata archaeon]|nr:hypothetical protein [Thermoplasmata archaeon]
MPSRRGAIWRAITVGSVVALLLVGAPLASALPALPSYAGVDLTLATNGTLTIAVTSQVTNGSALRFAMDGNFTPLLGVLQLNASETAKIVGTINGLESSPFTASLFGNRNGQVSAYEVTTFESLIGRESSLVPKGLLGGTGVLPSTLDGAPPLSESVGSVLFTGATGSDTSTAPIGVQVQSSDAFDFAGSTHTLTLGSPSLPFGLPGSLDLNLSFTTPAGEMITGVSGTTTDHVSNDPLGWGAASMHGTVVAATNSSVTVEFQNAPPVGTIAIILGSLAVGGLVAGGWLWRRRARAPATPLVPPTSPVPLGPPPAP